MVCDCCCEMYYFQTHVCQFNIVCCFYIVVQFGRISKSCRLDINEQQERNQTCFVKKKTNKQSQLSEMMKQSHWFSSEWSKAEASGPAWGKRTIDVWSPATRTIRVAEPPIILKPSPCCHSMQVSVKNWVTGQPIASLARCSSSWLHANTSAWLRVTINSQTVAANNQQQQQQQTLTTRTAVAPNWHRCMHPSYRPSVQQHGKLKSDSQR